MSTYIIETRQPATDDRSATPWTQDGLGDPSLYAFADRAEADRCAASLPSCGDEWARAEYRVREMI